MSKIYMVEFHRFYYFDKLDQEAVEDRYTVGYFSTNELAENAIHKCICESGYSKKDFQIIEYDLNISKNQKYLYILNYEFSVLNGDGEYEDFYYKYSPCTNVKKCIELKQFLIQNKMINIKKNAIYDVSKDGFYIDKIKIDFVNVVYL